MSEVVIGLSSEDADVVVETLVAHASRTQLNETQLRCFGVVIDKIRYSQSRMRGDGIATLVAGD